MFTVATPELIATLLVRAEQQTNREAIANGLREISCVEIREERVSNMAAINTVTLIGHLLSRH